MRIAIVGSRDYPNMSRVMEFVKGLPKDAIVVSGGARGVDKVAEMTAKGIGLETDIYPADWNKHGKRAGFIRNKDIVDNADRVVAFWDGKSRGTKNTISIAKSAGKKVTILS